MKKIIISLLITCLLFSGYIGQVELVNGKTNTAQIVAPSQNLPMPPTSQILPFR